MELPIIQYVAAGVILFLASVLQGMVGFASGLFGVPLLLLSGFSLPQAVAIVLLAAAVQTLTGTINLRREIDFRRAWKPVAIRLAFLPLGVVALWHFTALNPQLVKQAVGAFLLFVVIIQWLWPAATVSKPPPIWEWVAFSLSGFLLGVCGMGGPPMALWVMAQNWTATRSRAFLFFVLMTGMIPQGLLLWYLFGNEVTQAVVVGLLGIPLVLLGTALGLRIGAQLPRSGWRRIAYVILTLVALSAIITPFVTQGAAADGGDGVDPRSEVETPAESGKESNEPESADGDAKRFESDGGLKTSSGERRTPTGDQR